MEKKQFTREEFEAIVDRLSKLEKLTYDELWSVKYWRARSHTLPMAANEEHQKLVQKINDSFIRYSLKYPNDVKGL